MEEMLLYGDANPPEMDAASFRFKSNSEEEKYLQQANIKHVGCNDQITITYTPTIRVKEKICVCPFLEESSQLGRKAESDEVEIKVEEICFLAKEENGTPATVPLNEEESVANAVKIRDDQFNYRSITIQIKEKAKGKTYILKGNVKFGDENKEEKNSREEDDDYDLEKMNQHLAQGIVIFTVDRDRDMDIDMINENAKNRIESSIDLSNKNKKKIPLSGLIIGGSLIAGAIALKKKDGDGSKLCTDWVQCDQKSQDNETCFTDTWCKCEDTKTISNKDRCRSLVKSKHCEWIDGTTNFCQLREKMSPIPEPPNPVKCNTLTTTSEPTILEICSGESYTGNLKQNADQVECKFGGGKCKKEDAPSCCQVKAKCSTLTSLSKPTLAEICTGDNYSGTLIPTAVSTDCASSTCGIVDATTCCLVKTPSPPKPSPPKPSPPKPSPKDETCVDKYDNGQMEPPFGDDWLGCTEEKLKCSQSTVWKGCEKTCGKCTDIPKPKPSPKPKAKCSSLTKSSKPSISEVCVGGHYTGELNSAAKNPILDKDCVGETCGAVDGDRCCELKGKCNVNFCLLRNDGVEFKEGTESLDCAGAICGTSPTDKETCCKPEEEDELELDDGFESFNMAHKTLAEQAEVKKASGRF